MNLIRRIKKFVNDLRFRLETYTCALLFTNKNVIQQSILNRSCNNTNDSFQMNNKF